MLLGLIVALCSVTGFALADTDGYWLYTANTSGTVITGYNGPDKDIEIPTVVGGHTVVAIGAYAFSGKTIQSVSLPGSVVKIGSHAFNQCGSLKTVRMRNDMLSIEDFAFYYCEKLNFELYESQYPLEMTEVFEPTLGEHAFHWCRSLAEMPKMPMIVSIGTYALERTLIQEFEIPDTVTSIGSYAFADCEHINSIVIPEGITIIEPSTFSMCKGLEAVTLPQTLETIGLHVIRN